MEDDDDYAALLEGLCRVAWGDEHGSSFSRARTHGQGLDQATSSPFDIVFWDLRLPDATLDHVVASLERLRSILPVVVTTSATDLALLGSLVGSGVHDVLTKQNLSPAQLRGSVLQAMERSRREQELERRCVRLEFTALKFGDDFGVPLRRIQELLLLVEERFLSEESPRRPELAELSGLLQSETKRLDVLVADLKDSLKAGD